MHDHNLRCIGIITKHELVDWLCIDLTTGWLCILTLAYAK